MPKPCGFDTAELGHLDCALSSNLAGCLPRGFQHSGKDLWLPKPEVADQERRPGYVDNSRCQLYCRHNSPRACKMKSSEESFKAFLKLKSDLPNYPLESQTEADTRARLISRLLQEVLDWAPENVNREERANPGFMDYVLMTNRRIAVLEAKRSGDTFKLPADISTGKNFTVNGIIRTVKNLTRYIDQVSRYCFQNGIEYAIVSNGLQYVIFRAVRVDGIHIGQGAVIVFKDFDDIEARFVEFWSLLARSNVEDNSLVRTFQPSESAGFQYKRIADELRRYKEKLSRNTLSEYLEPLIAEYLGEISDEASRKKLSYCFVKGEALGKVLDGVARQISLHLSETVRTTGRVVEPTRVEDLQKGVKRKLDAHLKLPTRGQLLLLLGRVGCGKTTFVSHFLGFELKELFEKHILVPLDFRLLEKGGNLHQFFYQTLQEVLARNKPFSALTAKQLREVYKSEIRQLATGPLAALEKVNKKAFELKIAEFLLEQYKNSENHNVRVLRYLATKHRIRCVFVFDNVDQHDFELQQEIFRFAHTVTAKCYAFTLLTMWEETYFKSKQSGALSAYHVTAYIIPATSVVEIIDRRLDYIVREIEEGGLARNLVGPNAPVEDIIEFLQLVKNSIFRHGRRVRFFLECLAMGNLRKAMEIFSSFLTSGHTDAAKILWILRNHKSYLVPLHEFIKSIGLADYRYYRGELSSVLNLYSISDESRPSHFTKIRLLEYLYYHRNHTSALGLGFVRTGMILAEFQKIGTSEADTSESLRILAQHSLVENDVYDSRELGNGFRITPAGRYYVRYLAVRFAYLDLILQDTPIADAETFKKIKSVIDSRDMGDRFRRVEAFLDYLVGEEDREHQIVLHTSECIPLRRKHLFEMLDEYRVEKEYITKRLSEMRGEPTHVATPYVERR